MSIRPRDILALVIAASTASAQSGAAPSSRSKAESLIQHLATDQETTESIEELAALGAETLPRLMEALDSENAKLREHILTVIGKLGRHALPALESIEAAHASKPSAASLFAVANVSCWASRDLTESTRSLLLGTDLDLLKDGWKEIKELCRALQRLDVDPDLGTRELIAKLDSKQVYEREFAAELLGRLGSRDAIGPLRTTILTEHPRKLTYNWTSPQGSRHFGLSINADSEIQVAAARALVSIVEEQPESALGHAVLLRDGGTLEEQRRAASTLGRLGKTSNEIIDGLRAGLGSTDVEVLRESITSLGMLGSPARPALPALRKLKKNSDKQIALRAGAAIRQILN